MARKEMKAKLTGAGRRRGPVVLEFHDEVLSAILDSDGAHNSIQIEE
jgi:hypothetical protein